MRGPREDGDSITTPAAAQLAGRSYADPVAALTEGLAGYAGSPNEDEKPEDLTIRVAVLGQVPHLYCAGPVRDSPLPHESNFAGCASSRPILPV